MGYLGENIPKLGFGLMRLPKVKGQEGGGFQADIDMEQTTKMVDAFMSAGFFYFDTAYAYGKSETAIKDALVKRYPRDSYQLATKCPLWQTDGPDYFERIFNQQLERTGAGYFDFYLLHMFGEACYDLVKDNGGFEYFKHLKEKGLAKHIGFSCHDEPAFIEKALTELPFIEFVQIQLNYIDWDSNDVRSRECYEVCRKFNIPVTVMCPIKGGTLVRMNDEFTNIFKEANPNASVASWAMRYAASVPGLITVLSGMSNMEQMTDNINIMKNFKPLTDEERKVIDTVVAKMRAVPRIPCTDCKYCVDDCPAKINIPGLLGVYNHYKTFMDVEGAKGHYFWALRGGGKAKDCSACGVCEEKCPQRIKIANNLAEFSLHVD